MKTVVLAELLSLLLACHPAPVAQPQPVQSHGGTEAPQPPAGDLDGDDPDRDGVQGAEDQCPNMPEDRDGQDDGDGCPESDPAERDGDGIADAADQCPDDPEDHDGFQDQDGCPDPDNDMDGILDVDDLCPMNPEDRDGKQDDDGCPEP